MTIAALTWPEAAIYVVLTVTVGLIVAVLILSIFRTGQTAIRTDSRLRERVDNLGREVKELRTIREQSPHRGAEELDHGS
jgi:TRAP-type C4-dicarboxylate transport system permease small subunit